MSRYVTHKHGLVLGSDNWFFVLDRVRMDHDDEPEVTLPEGVDRDRDGYRAIVSFYGYRFDQPDTLNCFIHTPAFQLVWSRLKVEWIRAYTVKSTGEVIQLPMEKTYNVMSGWWENWLNTNVGAKYDKWDTYTRGRDRDPIVFFKRRTDALKFVKFIDERLKGIRLER